MEKTRILDEFVALTGHYRKHAVRLLGKACDTAVDAVRDGCVGSGRVYDEAVKEALIVILLGPSGLCLQARLHQE